MPRNTLIDVFTDLAATRGEFLVHDDGFRSVSRSYEDVGRSARALAARLAAAGVRQGDRIIVWGENRPEWVVALWAAIISGVVVVPIDYRSSLDFVRRIRAMVQVAALGHTTTDIPVCFDCHGKHKILNSSDPESKVGKERILETCGSCHVNANASFVKHVEHPQIKNWNYYKKLVAAL